MADRQRIRCHVITLEGRGRDNLASIRNVFPNTAVFPAIDARRFPDSVIKDLATPQTLNAIRAGRAATTDQIESRAAVGCFLSHRALWQECLETGEPIVVAEDDVLIRDPAALRALFDRIPRKAVFASLIHLPVPGFFFNDAGKNLNRFWKRVGRDFAGFQMYYITPAGAMAALRHSEVVSGHVDVLVAHVAMAEDRLLWVASRPAYNQHTLSQMLADNATSTLDHHVSLKKFLPESNFFFALVAAVLIGLGFLAARLIFSNRHVCDGRGNTGASTRPR